MDALEALNNGCRRNAKKKERAQLRYKSQLGAFSCSRQSVGPFYWQTVGKPLNSAVSRGNNGSG